MVDLEFTEIIMTGVKHLENWLKKNDYEKITIDIWQAGSADIKADSHGEKILVQAKTIQHPNEQNRLSATDKYALKDLATRLERTPYVAYLAIDDAKNLVGEIMWERLA